VSEQRRQRYSMFILQTPRDSHLIWAETQSGYKFARQELDRDYQARGLMRKFDKRRRSSYTAT
jgi:hypothetical protein